MGALELLLELVEGVLDLFLEAVVIIVVAVLGPVALCVMRIRHDEGLATETRMVRAGAGLIDRLRKGGDPRGR